MKAVAWGDIPELEDISMVCSDVFDERVVRWDCDMRFRSGGFLPARDLIRVRESCGTQNSSKPDKMMRKFELLLHECEARCWRSRDLRGFTGRDQIISIPHPYSTFLSNTTHIPSWRLHSTSHRSGYHSSLFCRLLADLFTSHFSLVLLSDDTSS